MIWEWDQIVSVMRQRRDADSTLIRGMIQVRDRYNADVVTPSPSVSGVAAANRPGPNFFQEGIDGLARTANESLPKIYCPVLDPEKDSSRKLASRREGALYGAWYENQLELLLYRGFRHLAAYGTHAMVVLPDDKLERASIALRDPLTAYPELRAADDIRSPDNCGFLFARSAQWITAHYPQAEKFVKIGPQQGWDTLWDVVEWIDEESIVIGIMGPRFPAYGAADARPYGQNALMLGRWPNKAGRCTVVVPRRATLDRIMGQMAAMINYSDLFSDMLYLQITATEKATFPDLVVMSRNGEVPELVGDKWQDGRTGNVNMLVNGQMEVIGKEAGPGTMPMLQLIDNHIRGSSGASTLYGGANGGMRTGVGVDALGDFSVNPMAAEAMKIMAYSLSELNVSWMDVQKGYYGDKKFTCILGLSGSAKTVQYIPNRDFKDTSNVVAYLAPGVDMNRYATAVAQMVATDMMSKKTGREKSPLIDSPQEEEQYVAIEKATDAALAGFAQEIAQGAKSSTEAALFAKYIASGMTTFDALIQAAADMKTQGAAQGAPGGPPATAPDGSSIPPALAQALAAQQAGPQQQPGNSIPAAAPGSMNLRHVLQGVNETVSPSAV